MVGTLTGGAGVEVIGTFRHLNGIITGNALASGHGAGVYVTGTYKVGPMAQVTGNKVGDKGENVYLPNEKFIALEADFELGDKAKIGVTTATKPEKATLVAVTDKNAKDISDFFFSDDATYYAKNGDDNVVQLALTGDGPTVKDEDNKDVTVEIPQEWREEQKVTPEEVMKPERKMKNGLPAWQNYVLGIEPTNELSGVYADAPQNKSTDVVTIETKNLDTSRIQKGYTVKYRLDKKLRDESTYTKGTKQENASFDVAIDGDGDPTGIYKLNAVIEKDGVELEQSAEAINTVGIVRATNTNKYCVIAVPWNKLAPGENEDIAVSNVIKTAGLEVGDKLHVYRHDKSLYDTWTLNADKTWETVATYKINKDGTVSTETSGEAAVATISRGNGVWLEHVNPTNAPYFLYGQANSNDVEVVVEKGHNLLAAPGITAWDLSNITGASENDQVIIPGAEPKLFTFKNGKWGYYKTTKFTLPGKTIFGDVEGTKVEWTTDESTIPAGTGFWLINKSGNVTV